MKGEGRGAIGKSVDFFLIFTDMSSMTFEVGRLRHVSFRMASLLEVGC